MSTNHPLKVGIFSGYDPRPWVMDECAGNDIKVLEDFVSRVKKLEGVSVLFPGNGLEGREKLCYTIPLAETYARRFADEGIDVLINVHQTWTFPQLSQKVVASFINTMKAKDPFFTPRIIIASIQDTQVPGMVSGMATGGALAQMGVNYAHVYGYFDSPAFMESLSSELEFFRAMTAAHEKIKNVVRGLHGEHLLEFGSFSLQMPTTRMNHEEIMARWGISSENLDQQVFLDRAFSMFAWEGEKGLSPIGNVLDGRVIEVLSKVYDASPGKFGVIPGRAVSRDKFALQTAMYFAVSDIAAEKGATAVTIKCQDECSARYATCCIATSFLGNDTGPEGAKKRMIPTSCETDLPTLLSQLFLTRITGKPAGFGDFRYVKTEGDRTVLAVVNCGQHPVYYAGKENDNWQTKLAATDFPGQEHFYAAGGAAVRMITAGGQEITLARLGVENGRLHLAGTIMDTHDVDRSKFVEYNEAWPIIEGRVPATDRVLGKRWPSNHLGFVYGNCLAELAELAEQLGIGYTLWDRGGREYHKPS
ncbi:MAG TPA: hypothetical protein ENN21_09415 [Spirochaetes bacterium]|nr:hypothetical protein [Spirochaetota bacterium]